MGGKLLLVILVTTVSAAALLVTRQQRINTAHELSTVHRQMLEHERALWRLRTEIANRCRPDEVRALLGDMPGSWRPIPDPGPRAAAPPPAAEPITGGAREAGEPLGG